MEWRRGGEKLGKRKMDVASSLECYIKDHGVTVEDAMTAFATMMEHAWRINLAYMELDRGILPTARVVADMTRTIDLWHLQGMDAFTFSASLKETVTSLFSKDFPAA
ncbi:hypothetical protein BAE44_0006475 [Dichanthelium oligosanthes]|uniref:Terpene synthase metal-binding domain-containing protein n=1 Tax=Dichanthelium oligosanthes TaxID=888268 RepID=A0A1E5W568_9POAL|nr:hypothetical protein BAE44_0006475 [Dichanthelium oligosanthes]